MPTESQTKIHLHPGFDKAKAALRARMKKDLEVKMQLAEETINGAIADVVQIVASSHPHVASALIEQFICALAEIKSIDPDRPDIAERCNHIFLRQSKLSALPWRDFYLSKHEVSGKNPMDKMTL